MTPFLDIVLTDIVDEAHEGNYEDWWCNGFNALPDGTVLWRGFDQDTFTLGGVSHMTVWLEPTTEPATNYRPGQDTIFTNFDGTEPIVSVHGKTLQPFTLRPGSVE